jgi:hypothetical protein
MEYYVVFSLLLLFSIIGFFKTGSYTKFFASAIAFILLVLFASLQGGGYDYDNYCEIFKGILHDDNIFSFNKGTSFYFVEIGYRILVKFASMICGHPTFMFFLTAFSSVFINFYCFKKYSPYIFLTIILYFAHTFLLREMIQIRAGLACAICLYSLIYIEQKKILKFTLCILIATSIHIGAIAFFLAYVFCQMNFSAFKLWVILLIAITIGMYMPLGALLHWLPNEKMMIYANSPYATKSLGIFTNITIIKSLFFTVTGLIYYNKMMKLLPHFRILFQTYFISLLLLLIFNDFFITGRIATFFSVTEVIIVPSYLLLFKQNGFNSLFLQLLIVLFAGLMLHLNIVNANIYPYVFIFE